MSSILPGYEYDIFISYRQNDNKRDGWVTSFVEALKDELEATLKNPVSLYFDENPHDGLLETHQVDASLEKKLKCLVFIPIISQTYCDTQSFAWEHEFMPFIEMAKQDDLGMNITLSNGNVVSRVLPVKIHNLDNEDQNSLEAILNGPLRSIDFIYQEPGVNRPLKPNDTNGGNQYHNQINKVANALKEIGKVLTAPNKEGNPKLANSKVSAMQSNSRLKNKKIYLLVGAMIVISALAYFIWGMPTVKNHKEYDYDIAVMYLENLTEDPKYADGLVNLIQINLAEDTSLNLVPRQKLYDALKDLNYKATAPDKTVATELASSIGAEYMIIGRVIQQVNEVLAHVELIEVMTGEVKATKKVKGNKDQIFFLADNITKELMKGRIPERNYNVTSITTSNYEAYKYFYEGQEHLWNFNLRSAREKFARAIELDSAFALAYVYAAIAENPFGGMNIYTDLYDSRMFINEASKYSSNLPYKDRLLTKLASEYFKHDVEFDESLSQIKQLATNNKIIFLLIQSPFIDVDIIEKEKLIQRANKRNPDDADLYNLLAYMYWQKGENEKAIVAVNNYLKYKPDLHNAYQSSWEINLMSGKPDEAMKYARRIEEKYSYKSRGVWRGISYLFALEPDSALSVYNQYYLPALTTSAMSLGANAYLLKGQWSLSKSTLNEMVNYATDSSRMKLAVYLRLQSSIASMVVGDYIQALKELDNIIEYSEKQFDYNPYKLVANFYKGLVFLHQGNVPGAEEQIIVIDQIIEDNESDRRFSQFKIFLEMEIALAKENYEELLSLLDGSAKIFRLTNARYFYLKLQYLIRNNMFNEAITYLDGIHRHLLANSPAYGGDKTLFIINLLYSNYYRGQIYEAQGENVKAIRAYKDFLHLLQDAETDLPEMVVARSKLKELTTN